ncbi:hypothetical protein BAE44_0002489 [Dichanthelium oligosanthes]|uniref:NB-ARC domain-containing protein n=1 Tax=Dichanthelium oligosanthes TaxID=888268 RepID=A0A1E5WGH6_9POAL|nr:hypothetical protein BAE44_0002489 [Dichanthelium oligosanthes]
MMLKQLQFLVDRMYQGYSVLDKFTYRFFQDGILEEEVRNGASILSVISSPLKRFCTFPGTSRYIVSSDDLQSALDSLEDALVNLSEFVVLLGGCERILRRPFDAYLYADNFMFGRHFEKQHITNILLQNPVHLSGPVVLPVIGGFKVGKKTLIAHVCNNERVRSHFSTILYINEDSMRSIGQAEISKGNTLFILELFSDIDNEDWVKFYSSVASMGGSRSKVIVITRLHNLARLGTIKPVYLNRLSREEFSYLFKILAFGSTDASEHPQLASVASKLATTILSGSLITANVIADLLRRKQNIKYWLHILQRFKAMFDHNLAKFGEHPRDLIEKEHHVEITGYTSSSYPVRLRLMMPPLVEGDDCHKRKQLSQVMFGDIIAGFTVIPKAEFEIVSWESRLPPYTKFVHSVETCVKEKDSCTTPQGKRRFGSL